MCLQYLLIIAVTVFGIAPTPLFADNGDIPLELQAKLFLTALTYDKNLEKRAEGSLDIGIVYFTDAPQSKKEAENFSNTLKAFKDKKISGRSFKTVLLAYNGNGALQKKMVDEHIDVLFITMGDEALVRKVLKLTQSEKILSCTSNADYVNTCGVTMAVGLKDNKPKIYLNLSSAKREGADFSAKFLRVAEIVDADK